MVACGVLAGLARVAQGQTEATAAEQPPADLELETVLVIGEQPGPGLWKVSKGDHVLWVLASHSPLAERLSLRTRQIEARIAESQEVLYPAIVNVYPSIGLLKILTLIPSALKVGKNPDGAMLEDVLPPAIYARWSEMRDKYGVGRDKKGRFDKDTEERRPAAAFSMLFVTAFARNGLYNGQQVGDIVRDLAKQHKVRVRRLPTLARAVKIDNPRGMLKDARRVPQAEIACLARAMETLEPKIARATLVANAWARGDIPQLRDLHREYQLSDDCILVTIAALTEQDTKDAARAKKVLDDFEWHAEQGRVQAQRDWVVAVQEALEKNPSTFAVLPVADVLRDGGHLDTLRALGYVVEEPI
jgi:hypothetical protein